MSMLWMHIITLIGCWSRIAFCMMHDKVHLVSILDHSAISATLLKIHSILHSTGAPSSLYFHFLIFEEQNFSINTWNNIFHGCFLTANFESVAWVRPPALQVLRNENFERDIIFCRFYLPQIFSKIPRLLYIDNDVLVNVDVTLLYQWPMIITNWKPLSHHPQTSTTTNLPHGIDSLGRTTPKSMRPLRPSISSKPAAVAMVYETHPFYRNYLSANFNLTHPLVEKVHKKLDKDLFLNAGVFLIDVPIWQQQNLTAVAEQIILSNSRFQFYSPSVGDQGTFYLLLEDRMSILPPEFNMRRLPKKTIHMLEQGQLGRC
jgi:lipopolysaccharide biosynthesis glycosyltransferase